jgi:hypothetical protein
LKLVRIAKFGHGKAIKGKVKTILLEALTSPEDSRRLSLPDFKIIGI